MFDKINKIGGMVHIVLPESNGRTDAARAKFADTGVDELLKQMLKAGANKQALVAKVAGGAHMFGGISKSNTLKVGERNAFKSKIAVLKLRIPIAAEDLGGSYGRTIELNTEDGSLMVKTVGKGTRTI